MSLHYGNSPSPSQAHAPVPIPIPATVRSARGSIGARSQSPANSIDRAENASRRGAPVDPYYAQSRQGSQQPEYRLPHERPREAAADAYDYGVGQRGALPPTSRQEWDYAPPSRSHSAHPPPPQYYDPYGPPQGSYYPPQQPQQPYYPPQQPYYPPQQPYYPPPPQQQHYAPPPPPQQPFHEQPSSRPYAEPPREGGPLIRHDARKVLVAKNIPTMVLTKVAKYCEVVSGSDALYAALAHQGVHVDAKDHFHGYHGVPFQPPLCIISSGLSLQPFLALKTQCPSLEMRFVPHMSGLHNEVRAAGLQNPDVLATRRRVFCVAQRGGEEGFWEAKNAYPDMLFYEWNQIDAFQKFVLEQDDARAIFVQKARDELAEAETESAKEEEKAVAAARTNGAAESKEAQKPEEGEQVDGDQPEAAKAGGKRTEREDEEEIMDDSPAKKAKVEEEEKPAVVEKVAQEGVKVEVPEMDPAVVKLEGVLERSRRSLAEYAEKSFVHFDKQMKNADAEPTLGQKATESGEWSIHGQLLAPMTPQAQVLLARAIRDLANPAKLRLYDTAEARKELALHVPWFDKVIGQVGEAMEAGEKAK